LWKITFPAYTGIPENEGAYDVFIYPNPVANSIQIDFSTKSVGSAQLVINDAQGKPILTEQSIKVQSGKNKINLDLSKIKAGMYFYSLTVNGFSRMGKISIVR
jgi:hypothetical protein